MSHKDGRVVLSAWVEPLVRDYAREAAKVAHLEFSRWVERAVRQTMARESADRAETLKAQARHRPAPAGFPCPRCGEPALPDRGHCSDACFRATLRSTGEREEARDGASVGPPPPPPPPPPAAPLVSVALPEAVWRDVCEVLAAPTDPEAGDGFGPAYELREDRRRRAHESLTLALAERRGPR